MGVHIRPERASKKEHWRQLLLSHLTRFPETEFERFSFGYRADGTAPIQNKVGAFLADPLLNRILTSAPHDLQIRQINHGGEDASWTVNVKRPTGPPGNTFRMMNNSRACKRISPSIR